MSASVLMNDVLFFQRFLRAEGLYEKRLDGKWGPHTEAAAVQFEARSEAIARANQIFDTRSESSIRTLASRAQTQARRFLARLAEQRIEARIISGTRTYAEQDALFRKGRYGNRERIVTNARGGRSNHNFGIAWDIGLFTRTGAYITAAEPYVEASRIAMSEELEWGGDWARFKDPPHYQLKLPVTLAELRDSFESGGAVVFA